MRVLHTSDWHLGVTYCDQSRADEQASFLRWLLGVIEERQVDALVVAGDVFHPANPPAEALSLYYGFLAKLSAMGGVTLSGGRRTAVIVGGNHDAASRLDAPREALAALNAHVIGGHDSSRAESELGGSCGQLIPLSNGSGDVGLVVAAVPFLNDWRLGVRGFDATAEEQSDGMHTAFRDVYLRLADKAEKGFPGVPLMATGHLTCLAARGDVVTADDAVPFEINRVGTLGAMGPDVFDPRFCYVALGHIHRGFSVDGAIGRVRYPGTPVQVSAIEGHDSRRVLLATVDASGASVESLAVPVRRRLIALRGSFEAVRDKLRTLEWATGELPPYVSIDALLDGVKLDAEAELRDVRTNGPGGVAEVLNVRAEVRRAVGASGDDPPFRSGHLLSPSEAFAIAWSSVHGHASAPPIEVAQRFSELVARAGQGES